jgi:hypothetical protein
MYAFYVRKYTLLETAHHQKHNKYTVSTHLPSSTFEKYWLLFVEELIKIAAVCF